MVDQGLLSIFLTSHAVVVTQATWPCFFNTPLLYYPRKTASGIFPHAIASGRKLSE
jgi:hypothetical protein